ncbi:alpha/beta hydrolase [Leadbetterella byssophila]|uniref:alpha/beta hydrolase n=1 Tax=Leadbetterella byssophila TaxID=316068 RepID=UPI00399F8A3B
MVRVWILILICHILFAQDLVKGREPDLLMSYAPGRKIEVHRASGISKAPMIMLIHGGGWSSGEPAQMRAWADTLSKLGYVCLSVQYTLSGEGLYPAAVKDLKAAIAFIHKNAAMVGGDKNKLALLGFSAGGQLASLLGTTWDSDLYGKDKTRIHAVVNMDGILAFIHPESGEGDDSKKPSAATRWFGYPKDFSTKHWEEASALNHVSEKTPPHLFLNSSVNRMQAGRREFQARLAQWNIYSEAHKFEDAPHDFCLKRPWLSDAVTYTHSFLKKVLP